MSASKQYKIWIEGDDVDDINLFALVSSDEENDIDNNSNYADVTVETSVKVRLFLTKTLMIYSIVPLVGQSLFGNSIE